MYPSHKYSSAPEKHLNSYIHSIISHIKQTAKPCSFTDINKNLKINLYQNPLILAALKKNPKIIIENDMVTFKPAYQILNKSDLLSVVKNARCREGIELNELLDCPTDINGFIAELISENKIFMIKDMDGSQIVFYNVLVMPKASDEVRELWSKVKVPDYQEVKRELKNAGLKSGNEEKTKKYVVENKKKVKRFNRKIKITNTHVKDLNLD